jgi:hypothetical protein
MENLLQTCTKYYQNLASLIEVLPKTIIFPFRVEVAQPGFA